MPFELASALPTQIEEVGAIAGIVSFVLMLTINLLQWAARRRVEA